MVRLISPRCREEDHGARFGARSLPALTEGLAFVGRRFAHQVAPCRSDRQLLRVSVGSHRHGIKWEARIRISRSGLNSSGESRIPAESRQDLERSQRGAGIGTSLRLDIESRRKPVLAGGKDVVRGPIPPGGSLCAIGRSQPRPSAEPSRSSLTAEGSLTWAFARSAGIQSGSQRRAMIR